MSLHKSPLCVCEIVIHSFLQRPVDPCQTVLKRVEAFPGFFCHQRMEHSLLPTRGLQRCLPNRCKGSKLIESSKLSNFSDLYHTETRQFLRQFRLETFLSLFRLTFVHCGGEEPQRWIRGRRQIFFDTIFKGCFLFFYWALDENVLASSDASCFIPVYFVFL